MSTDSARIKAIPYGTRHLPWSETAALIAWCIPILAISIRISFFPHHNTVFFTYEEAGRNWLAGRNLYTNYRGFVYSPLAAAFFAPFSLLPEMWSNLLWRALNLSVFLGAVLWWMQLKLHPFISERHYGVILLLLLPLSTGNLNNGQVNPLITGLLMIAIIGARTDSWGLSAFCIGVATYFKIYPLAEGLLLVLLFPRQFALRLILALLALGLLSFLLQKPAYVFDQYRHWIATRTADDRRLYKPEIAPRDLWLLFRFIHLSVTEYAYKALQVLSGVGIAGLCLFGHLRGWTKNRLLVALFTLVCCWMLLCGPATESATYILLAPAIILALVGAFAARTPSWLRGVVLLAYLVLLAALWINSFTHFNRTPISMIIQPIGALLFSVYALFWILDSRFWSELPVREGSIAS